jgi:hypothetical protein
MGQKGRHRRNHHGDRGNRSPKFLNHGTIYILVPPPQKKKNFSVISVSFRVVTPGGGGRGAVWGGADEPLSCSGVFRNQSTGGGSCRRQKISPTETNGHQTSM